MIFGTLDRFPMDGTPPKAPHGIPWARARQIYKIGLVVYGLRSAYNQIDAIRNDPNLTPEQKADRVANVLIRYLNPRFAGAPADDLKAWNGEGIPVGDPDSTATTVATWKKDP